MPSLQDMMSVFLEKIKAGEYKSELLDNQSKLSEKIAKDLSCDTDKAKSLLGYLLKFEYVKIDSEKGIVLTDKMNS
jgi:hypothetical protein